MSQEQQKPFNQISLKDYTTIEAAVNIVKSLVKPDLAKFITRDIVEPVWTDPDKRKIPLSSLETFFNRKANAVKEIDSLESWTGVHVGGQDIRKWTTPIEQVRGQNHVIVKDDGETRLFTAWGHNIGPRGEEVRAPHLKRMKVKVAPRRFKYSDGSEGHSWDGKFIEEEHPIPLSELREYLGARAKPLSSLSEDDLYKGVLLRGKIGVILPVPNFVPSETEFDVVKDSDGNVVYQTDENGNAIVDPTTNQPIPKRRPKMVPDNVGKPLKQTKADNSNEVQWVFKLSLYDDDDSHNNRVSIQFLRTKFGDHSILMPSANAILESAAKNPVDGSRDILGGFSELTDTWGTKEVIIAGIPIRRNEEGDDVWYNVNGTLMIVADPNAVFPEYPGTAKETEKPQSQPHPAAPTQVQQPQPQPQPQTPAPTPEPTPEPTKAEPAQTDSVQPVTTAPNETEQLKKAIETAMDVMGDDIDYEMLMSMNVGMPEKYKHETQKEIVKAFMSAARGERKERAEAPTITAETAPQPPQQPQQPQPETQPGEKQKIQMPGQPAVADISPEEIKKMTQMKQADTLTAEAGEPTAEVVEEHRVEPAPAKDEAPVPPGYVPCGKCGKILTPSEVATHQCDV